MNKLLVLIAWIAGTSLAMSGESTEEARYIGFLHKLQYAETLEDLKRLIPDCPPPRADAGDGNLEIIVKTKLFGLDATGEFNFHNGILVSHGFNIPITDQADAHRVFLDAAKILDSQAGGLKTSVSLPIDKDYMDCPSAPPDVITIYIDGVDKDAIFQLRLVMKGSVSTVEWGAQKVRQSGKPKIEQNATGKGDEPTR